MGAWWCLYFEGQTGTIKNQPDAKQLETKAQLEGRKGCEKWDGKKKKKKKSIWRGLGLTSQRLGPGVGSGGDAELLGKEWEAPGNGALSGQRDRDKKVAFQNGKMLR